MVLVYGTRVSSLYENQGGKHDNFENERQHSATRAGKEDRAAMAALALARAGDTAAAEKLAAELDKTFPLDTLVQRYWLPTIRAGVALERQDPNRAIELLKEASTVELGQPTPLGVWPW